MNSLVEIQRARLSRRPFSAQLDASTKFAGSDKRTPLRELDDEELSSKRLKERIRRPSNR